MQVSDKPHCERRKNKAFWSLTLSVTLLSYIIKIGSCPSSYSKPKVRCFFLEHSVPICVYEWPSTTSSSSWPTTPILSHLPATSTRCPPKVDNIEMWARTNSLTLNRTKTKEVVFVDTRRKCQVAAPPPLPGIVRVTSLNILGVTMTNGLSASDHVRGIISDCAQTLYALRVLRAHGMCDMSFCLPIAFCQLRLIKEYWLID